MAIPPMPSTSPATETAAAVEEIMGAYRSLPQRPTVEEVEAATAVIDAANAEEEARVHEASAARKPSGVPGELFQVVMEVRRNLAMLHGYEQRREALAVLELDKRLQVFDEFIQRASMVVSPDAEGTKKEQGKTEGFAATKAPRIERSFLSKDDSGITRAKPNAAALKLEVPSGADPEKLSLVQVASLIESHAKKGTQVLDLQGKLREQIEWLPPSLGKLKDVKDLNLSENRIVTLPPSIGDLRHLVKLDLNSNQLDELPDSIGELSNLTDLDLHANRLKSLPESFANLEHLVNLDVSTNQLSTLPGALGNLKLLKKLNAETNELEELPYTIGSCSSLAELRLDFNQLKGLPEAVGKLESLEVLTLHYNKIKGLPTTMATLFKLRELDVSFNELEFIPESLCFATALVKLNVGRNFADLRSLPRSIGNLEMLEELDISSNQIRVLPESFRFLSSLRVLLADETPLEVPPRQVLKLGAQGVVEYMADLVKAKESAPSQASMNETLCSCLCSLLPLRGTAEEKAAAGM